MKEAKISAYKTQVDFKIVTEDDKFRKYLQDTVDLEKVRKIKKKTTSKLDIKIKEHDQKAIKRNDDKKVDYLDKYLFGSLANLLYFFQFLKKHPALVDKFGEDVEELLGLKIDKSEVWNRSHGIEALLNAIVGYGYYEQSYIDDERFNYKKYLLPILQNAIHQNTSKIMKYRKRHGKPVGKEILFQVMVDNDFARVKTWTEFVEQPPANEMKRIRRKILTSKIKPDA